MECVEVFPEGQFLADKAFNYTSQFGEDGLIEAALHEYGCLNRWCFEVGAADGRLYSNTARLREQGWDCILIEGEAESYEKLRQLQTEKVRTVPKRITTRCLDRILREQGAPKDIDFGVIDIDGQDYWVWDGLREFRPRLLLVEFDYGSDGPGDKQCWTPTIGGEGQATYQAIRQLGENKQYTALAKTPVNLLFVASEIL